MSVLKVNSIVDANSGNTAQINGMTPTADSLQGFRNRIINGDMRIDQRNAGASVTPATGAYTLDRWRYGATAASKVSIQQSSTAPAGFTNSLLVTSLSAYSVGTSDSFDIQQPVEGLNASDLSWGTASAQSVTLSFWVRSSLTGTFGGVLLNSGFNRSYAFSYSIDSANTWEKKSVTIVGDTTGTWLTTNGVGIRLIFTLGAGTNNQLAPGAWSSTFGTTVTGATNLVATNGATWQITGVQLEAGSVATPFERRPFGTELQLCQRYYQKHSATGRSAACGYNRTASGTRHIKTFPVPMRSAPTTLETTGNAADYQIFALNTSFLCSAVPTFTGSSEYEIEISGSSSGLTAGQGAMLAVGITAFLAWSAEL